MKDELKAYFLIIAIGVGYLFPLSALTQPVDYWHLYFPNINIEFPLTSMYMWVNLAVLGFVVFFRTKVSITFRIVGGFIGQLLVLLLVPNIPYLTSDMTVHFWLIMLLTGLAAAATALIDSVAIGFAAQYPPKVLEGLQFGIGLSTLIGSIFRILTKAIFSSKGTLHSSIIYFYIGAFTIFLCILSYYYLISLPISENIRSNKFESTAEENLKLVENKQQQPYYQDSTTRDEEEEHHHHDHDQKEGRNPDPFVDEDSERTRKVHRLLRNASGSNLESPLTPTDPPHHAQHPPQLVHQSFPRPTHPATEDESQHAWINKLRILRKVIHSQSLVFLVYFISLITWPGMITEIPTYSFPALEETKWWTLLLLLNFSVFDCLGRLCTHYRFGLTSQNIWMVVYGRILVIPLIYWIASGQLSVIFHSDILSIGLVSMMGFTNGYLGSLCVIMVTEDVHPEEKEIAGAFTGFFLNVGLVFGSTVALCFQN